MRDFGDLNGRFQPEWEAFIKSLFSKFRDLSGRGGREMVRVVSDG